MFSQSEVVSLSNLQNVGEKNIMFWRMVSVPGSPYATNKKREKKNEHIKKESKKKIQEVLVESYG